VVFGGGVELHGHVHESEAEGALPDGAHPHIFLARRP
jgi:hypothetical protein